jgi:uncharacterized RDD family membrane protein YckC
LSATGSALFDTSTLDLGFCEATGHSHAATAASPDALRYQVAQRLAAHRDRRGRLRPQPSDQQAAGPSPEPSPASIRATRIAAAVAERYAQSPSYRAFLAAEAERAIEQAQAAAEVAALNAQAVAHAQKQLLDRLYSDRQDRAPDNEFQERLPKPHEYLTEESGLWPASDSGQPVDGGTQARRAAPAKDLLYSSPAKASPSEQLSFAPRVSPQGAMPTRSPLQATSRSSGLTVHLYEGPAPAMTPLDASRRYIGAGRDQNEEQNDAEARVLDEEIAFRQAPVFEEAPGPPIQLPANLIEFPRQLVAPRKARPRYAEGPLREDDAVPPGGSQLRIFEVDPAQISTTPEVAEAPTPQWTSIWLDTPRPAADAGAAAVGSYAEPGLTPESWEASHPAQSSEPQLNRNPRPQTAPIARRLVAAAIDGGLILAALGAFAATFAVISLHDSVAPEGTGVQVLLARTGSILAGHGALQPGAAMAAIATAGAFLYLLYQGLFFSLSEATPGMRIARIALCTFADENPTRPAMRRRILAVLLSACPLGLGFLWAALDEDRLGWHDLISRMYQRSY